MSKLTDTIKREFKELLPPTIFFFVMLHLVVLVRTLMTRGTGLSIPTSTSVTIAALILGKAVLIANAMPFINRFPEKPLIWNAAWKTLIYTLVALLIHYLERLYDYWKDAHSLAAANHQLLTEMNWAHFLAIQILLVTLIVNYCVFAELARVIGRDKLRAMFFKRLPERSAPSGAG
jgi:hypothetical protein